MSNFDPNVFLTQPTTTVDERRPPLPVDNPTEPDGLYMAFIGEITTASGTIGKGERAGQPWVSMVIPLKIQVPQRLQEGLKLRQELTITDRAFLDLTPEGTSDDAPGRNRKRKDYREATGMNNPGEPFIWSQLSGKVVKVKIAHETYNDVPQERIAGIFKS